MYLDLLIDTTNSFLAIKKRATDAQISVKKKKERTRWKGLSEHHDKQGTRLLFLCL